MNIFEFHERYRISLSKARKIAKENPGWFDGSSDKLDAMRSTIAKGNALSAVQLVHLIEEPGDLLELGDLAEGAEKQLASLGKPRDEIAPKTVSAYILDAAKADVESVAILVAWIKSILPPRPVRHSYIATRLLLGLAPSLREESAPRIPRALMNCRRSPDFAGWWRVEKSVSRNVTLYQKKAFDL